MSEVFETKKVVILSGPTGKRLIVGNAGVFAAFSTHFQTMPKKPRLLLSFLAAFLVTTSLLAEDPSEATPSGVPVAYQLPTDGDLPKTYRVTLAITAPNEPDWIVCTFVSGEERTVTKENPGKFTDFWNGWDDNFMQVPPGNYGVKGISKIEN